MKSTASCMASCALLLVGLLPAQTFVVDANNGPGTNFTSITAAVAAVPDGATLLVRPGSYQPFRLDGKGLWILADAGAQVTGTTTVRNTQSNQSVILSGLDFTAVTPGTGAVLQMNDCVGPVVLAQITTPATVPPVPVVSVYWLLPRGLAAQRCNQLILRSCTIVSVVLSHCVSVIESCTLRGNDAALTPGFPASANDGLTVADGSAQVVGATEIIGGDGLPGLNDALGLKLITSNVSVRSGAIRAGSGSGATPAPAVLSASATLRLDPSVALVTTFPLPILGTAASIVAMPEVRSWSAPPGGTMQADVATAAGDLVALFVGELRAPVIVPGLPEPFWFDPTAVLLLTVGVQMPAAPISGSISVPNLASLRGASLVWQAITLGATGLAVTNPSLALVD